MEVGLARTADSMAVCICFALDDMFSAWAVRITNPSIILVGMVNGMHAARCFSANLIMPAFDYLHVTMLSLFIMSVIT